VETGLDVCVSGSKDGTCIIHNLQRGVYLRSIHHPTGLPITLVAVSSLGHVVFYSKEDLILHVYDINGTAITCYDVPERLEQIYVPLPGRHVITAAKDGTLTIREIHSYVVSSIEGAGLL
jgi:WD40 repeat protein